MSDLDECRTSINMDCETHDRPLNLCGYYKTIARLTADLARVTGELGVSRASHILSGAAVERLEAALAASQERVSKMRAAMERQYKRVGERHRDDPNGCVCGGGQFCWLKGLAYEMSDDLDALSPPANKGESR